MLILSSQRWGNATCPCAYGFPTYNSAKYTPLECRQPVDQRDFFACHLCLRIRSAGKFANAMMKGKRGKLGMGSVAERSRRFCIPCGVAHQKYQQGTCLQFGGASGTYGVVCCRCGEFGPIRHGCDSQLARKTCDTCWNHAAAKKSCTCNFCRYRIDWVYDPQDISVDCSDWRDILF